MARVRLAVHAAIVCLAGSLAGSAARASPGPNDGQEVGAGTIAVSAGPGLDAGALREALALRLPGVRLHEAVDGELSCETGCVWASVEREPDDSLRISVRLADGRVFARRWPATPAEPERAAATSLSHLLAAIADGTAEPEPAVEAAQPDPPRVTVEPQVHPTPPITSPPVVDRSSPPPRFEIGPTVGLVTAFGVGAPAALAGPVGSGGLVGAELRHRNGLLAGLEVRALGARAEGLRLGRVRVTVALGHSFRRGRFELRTRAAFLLEPWWVGTRVEGARVQSGSPLLGAALSLTPGLSLALAPDLRVDVGLRMEAAVSAHAGAGAAVQLVDRTGAPVFRLGGVELAAAAEIGVRWGRPKRRR